MDLSGVSAGTPQSWLGKAWRSLKDIAQEHPRDSYFRSELQFGSEDASRQAFLEARQRLLRPDGWKELGPKWGAARFEVHGAQARQDKNVQQGDLLKIHLPAFPRATWVRVESVVDEPDRLEVRVRPTGAPGTRGVDHIFGEATTNTFTLERLGEQLVGGVQGKNEVANFSGPWWQDLLSASFLWGGWMGGKDHQWKPFVHNLLRGPNRID
jgi:hypothetical protein